MTRIQNILAAGAASIFLVASGAGVHAATLLHHFDFETTANDTVGSATGTLQNGAQISGGVLMLDGVNDYMDTSAHLIPTAGAAFTLGLQAKSTATSLTGISEMISQGFSTFAGGFYMGFINGQIRLTDQFGAISSPFPADGNFHDYVLTSAAGDGTRLFIDGAQVFFDAQHLTPVAGGTATRLGTQFNQAGGFPFSEYFAGEIDNVKIYSGALTSTEVQSAFATVPIPSSIGFLVLGLAGLGAIRRSHKR